MAYNSIHSGPALDAAVSRLAEIEDIRQESNTNLATVEQVAGQVATNAQAAVQAKNEVEDARVQVQTAEALANQSALSALEAAGTATTKAAQTQADREAAQLAASQAKQIALGNAIDDEHPDPMMVYSSQKVQEGFNAFGDATDPDKGAAMVGFSVEIEYPDGSVGRSLAEIDRAVSPTNGAMRAFPIGEGTRWIELQDAPGYSYPAISSRSGDPDEKIDFSIAAQAAGDIYLGNGAGPQFQVIDPGEMATTRWWGAKGGDASNLPVLFSHVGGAFDMGTGSGGKYSFRHSEVEIFSVGPTNASAVQQTRWEARSGAAGDNYARLSARGEATNITAYLSAQGAAPVVLANGAGNVITATSQSGSTAAVHLLVRSNASGQPVQLRPTGETNASLSIAASGTGKVTVDRLDQSSESFLTGFSVSYNVTSGFSIVWPAGKQLLILHEPTLATVAAGAISLPAAPVDGQMVRISSMCTVTSLTITGGSPVSGSPGTITPASPLAFLFSSTLNRWVRV